MDASKILQQIIIFLVSAHNVSSLTMQTKDVVTVLQEDDSVILNCTYHKESTEDITSRNIRWQKEIENAFKDIAMFSQPGDKIPFIEKDMQPAYSNRTTLIAPNTSLSAVVIIKDPVCGDGGTYRCWIEYYSDNSEKIQTSRTVVEFDSKARAPEKFAVFPNELEENQSIRLTCSANVGSPRGYIQIWKFFENFNRPELIYQSNSTDNKINSCTKIINVTTTYTITRYDNRAMFRCSSQNNLTQGAGPIRESNKISMGLTRLQSL